MPDQVKENYMANMSNQLCLKLTCKKEKKAGRHISSETAHLQPRQKVYNIAILSQSWLTYVAIIYI